MAIFLHDEVDLFLEEFLELFADVFDPLTLSLTRHGSFFLLLFHGRRHLHTLPGGFHRLRAERFIRLSFSGRCWGCPLSARQKTADDFVKAGRALTAIDAERGTGQGAPHSEIPCQFAQARLHPV